MPTYTFTDSVPRYYVDLGLEARTGKVYELDHAPDDRFKLVGTDEAKNPNRPTDPNQVIGGVESTKEGGVSIPQGAYVVTGTQGVAESTPQAPFDASIIPDDPKGA